MKRTVNEIVAERNARIAEVKAKYSEDAIKISSMCADIINADFLTPESRAKAFTENGITAEAAELNRGVNAICAEYAEELRAAEEAENESEQVPEWLADLIEF